MNILPISLLTLLALPALLLAQRVGAFERRFVAWGAGGLALALTWLCIPEPAADLSQIRLLKLLLATVAALLVFARSASWRVARTSQDYRRGLIALATLGVLTYLNFGAFHGQRTFLHLHDLAHYYLGAKYYAELGPTDLYGAMLRAESEWTGDRFRSLEARDLAADELVHIRSLLSRSDAIKAKFSTARWEDFQIDVAMFREALGPQYPSVLRDHGFNATPVWALLGSPLARRVPAGALLELRWLALLDPVITLCMLGAIGWAFGVEASLLALLYLCVVFGAGFAWTGGGFLRTPWLAALVGFACCLQRRKHAAAGVLLAISTGLRLFPVFFALPLLARALASYRATGALPRSSAAFLAAFAATACILLASTASLPRGLQHWSELETRLSRHAEVLSPNLVGLTQLLAYRPGGGLVTRDELRSIRERREDIHRVQLWLVALPLLLLVLRQAPRRSEAEALVLAIPLIFASLSLASYYSSVLVLLVLVYRRRPELLALLFAVEAASFLASFSSEQQALWFALRSGLLTLVCSALLFAPGLVRESKDPA